MTIIHSSHRLERFVPSHQMGDSRWGCYYPESLGLGIFRDPSCLTFGNCYRRVPISVTQSHLQPLGDLYLRPQSPVPRILTEIECVRNVTQPPEVPIRKSKLSIEKASFGYHV